MDNSQKYVKGDNINLMVNKTNYNDAKIETVKRSIIGSIIMCGALTLMSMCYLNFYLTHR